MGMNDWFEYSPTITSTISTIKDAERILEKQQTYTPEVDQAFSLDINTLDPTDKIPYLYLLNDRYSNNLSTVPEEKKPLFQLKYAVLQTWFNSEIGSANQRIRQKWTVNITQKYWVQYDMFTDYDNWSKDGMARLRFPLPKIKNFELLNDMRIDESWKISNSIWVNYAKKVWKNKFQLWLSLKDQKDALVTWRIKTIHWSFGTKHILSYTFWWPFKARNELTYELLEKLSILLSIKTKIAPELIEINPMVGLEYNF